LIWYQSIVVLGDISDLVPLCRRGVWTNLVWLCRQIAIVCFSVVFKFDFRIYPSDLVYNEDQPRRVDPGFGIIIPLAFVSSLMTSQNVSWIYLFHFQYNQCTLVQLLQKINITFLIEIRKNATYQTESLKLI